MFSPGHSSVASWQYRDAALSLLADETVTEPECLPALPEPPRFSENEVRARVDDALAQAHTEWAAKAAQQQERAEAILGEELRSFGAQRAAYFRQAEAEVVQLVLGIARKILQREAALDPALLSGLVRVALDRVGADTAATVRVPPDALTAWQRALQAIGSARRLDVLPDPLLNLGECSVECGAGVAVLSMEAQLKELEQSFHDLMAVRPGTPRP